MMNFHQKGQALLPMLAFIIILAIAVVFLFNTSQVLAERTQAKVLADHAAYNTAVKQAQLLNANAYMNKAKMANQLATAQAVSVASWAKHFDPVPKNSSVLNAIPVVGSTIHQGITAASQSIQPLADLQSLFVTSNGVATKLITEQQKLLNTDSYLAITQQPELILKKSSIGSNFEATPLKLSSQFSVDPFGKDFIDRYQGNSTDPYVGRMRMKDVLLTARDSFTNSRRSDRTIGVPFPGIKIERRGGTELSPDLNQWKGADTFSYYYYKIRRFRLVKQEVPIGYGSAVVRANNNDNDASNRAGYDKIRTNAKASGRTSSYTPIWDTRHNGTLNKGEFGVPEFWDLSKDFLAQDNPNLNIAIKVSKDSNRLDTTQGISKFKVGKKIDIDSDNDITAISTAQVYFERPLQDKQGKSTFLNSGKYEKASLFNPYWTVKLTDNTKESIAEGNIP